MALSDELAVAHLDGRMRATQVMFNGLTEEETMAAASCIGLMTEPAGEYPALPRPFIGVQDQPWGGHKEVIRSAIGEDGVVSCYTDDQMRAYADATCAMRAAQPAGEYPAAPEGVAFIVEYGGDVFTLDQMRAFADATHALRASHGQAPAQAAPAAVAGPSEFPHEQMDVMALARYKVMPSHESMLHRHAVVAGDGSQQLYIGREVECENMARKFAGAFLDGAFAFHSMLVAAPTTQAAPVAPEALDDDCVVRRVQDRTGNWIEFDAAHELFDPVAVDAARAKAKEGQSHE